MKDVFHSDVITNPWVVVLKPRNLKQIKVNILKLISKIDLGRWPEKSCKVVLGLLQNLEANA